MSAKYESSGNPATIARTPGDIGGASYGTYQLTEKSGSAKEFVNYLKSVDKVAYNALAGKKPGTIQFDAAWKKVAANNKNFGQYQHNFIQQKYYEPAVKSLIKNNGLDVSKRSLAVQNAIWSTAVQHGAGSVSKIVKAAGISPMDSDEYILKKLYAERGAKNGMKYFSSSSTAVRNGVVKRFGNELNDALRMLT